MRKKDISLIIAAIIVIAGGISTLLTSLSAPSSAYIVTKVIDGDTIVVREPGFFTPEATVRLLGVNTPETVDPRRPVECFGHEASAFVKAALPLGSYVFLEHDPDKPDTDKYGRLLRYVRHAEGSGELLNQQILAGGYGYEESYGERYSMRDTFRSAESDARREGRGLWKEGRCKNEK